jgi:hypothetical protein
MKIQQLKIKVRNLQEYRDLQDSSTSLTNHLIQLNHVSKIRILKTFYPTKRLKRILLAW